MAVLEISNADPDRCKQSRLEQRHALARGPAKKIETACAIPPVLVNSDFTAPASTSAANREWRAKKVERAQATAPEAMETATAVREVGAAFPH